jgi:hypothetical protein
MMRRNIARDGAVVQQASHSRVRLNSGRALPAGTAPPFLFRLDPEIEGGGVMPTLFDIPTLVAKRAFIDLLQANGVDNLEVVEASIQNPLTGETITDYSYVNIIGLVEAASLEHSATRELGENVRLVDNPVLVSKAWVAPFRLFRLAEDPRRIIIDDGLAEAIRAAQFGDIYLKELSAVE